MDPRLLFSEFPWANSRKFVLAELAGNCVRLVPTASLMHGISISVKKLKGSNPCGIYSIFGRLSRPAHAAVRSALRFSNGADFLKIAYLVHDLSDPAVHRRVRMLKAGAGQIKIAGFTRVATPPKHIEGCEAISLGLTRDGQLLERIGSVAMAALRLERLKEVLGGCQLVLARNLEMLFLASAARRRYAADAALVFECLDIHRLLLRDTLSRSTLASDGKQARQRRRLDHDEFASFHFRIFQASQFGCANQDYRKQNSASGLWERPSRAVSASQRPALENRLVRNDKVPAKL